MAKFYRFLLTKENFEKTQSLAFRNGFRHFIQAAIFGFTLETIFIKFGVYENIVKKSTRRRLDHKRLEDQMIDIKLSKKE